jgi:hypothetical protein
VFGRQKQTDSMSGGATYAWSWPRSGRIRQQRNLERADAELISEVRWQWRSACANSTLAPMIYTPCGATRAVPVIVDVDLGPPVALIVKVRPGQSVGDFVKAAPAIAEGMGVMALEVTSLASHWVRVVLIDRPAVRMPHDPAPPAGKAWYGA